MKPATTTSGTKSHIVQIVASTHLLFLLGLVALLVGCGSSPESARKNLAKLGKDFNPATFIECVGNGDKEAVRLFLAAGMDVNAPGDGGITALAAAAMKGNTELVRTLLDNRVGSIVDNGQQLVARDKFGKNLGYYDKQGNVTRDRNSNRICQGDALASLVFKAAGS